MDAPHPHPPVEPSLQALLDRLEAQSLLPMFRQQRALALQLALRPYFEASRPLLPRDEEMDLATLYLYADFFPQDGQLSLIEQVRDTIETHVPEEERAWLDPLRHSAMDLLEVAAVEPGPSGSRLRLRSFGGGEEFLPTAGDFGLGLQAGQALLTRLVRLPDRAVFAGAALVLSPANARQVFEAVQDWRRDMELSAGAFSLRDWPELAKRYGYLFLWQVAQLRLQVVIEEEAGMRFLDAAGGPYLYALAQYEHADLRQLDAGLGAAGFRRDEREPSRWHQDEDGQVVARLTLTPFELTVECDSPERLNDVKHRLAAAFGFLLHFRGEATVPPEHEAVWHDVDLSSDEVTVPAFRVGAEQNQRLFSAFLDAVYLEWADRPSPALEGETPRHVAAKPGGRERVSALIDGLEDADPGRRRFGQAAFNYNRLRAQVGLAEVAR